MDITAQVDKLSDFMRESGYLAVPLLDDAHQPASIEPGQVWRARWDDALALVFVDSVLGGFKNSVRVAPITIGTDDADDTAVLLPASSNSLSIALSIWPALVSEIAEVVLEHWVTDFTSSGLTSLLAINAGVSSGELRTGFPILNPDSPRREERELLVRLMAALVRATDLVAGTGRLPEMFTVAGVAVKLIATTLDVDNPWALKVRRGEVPIDQSQAEALAPVLNRTPRDVLEGNPAIPEGLLAEVTSIRRGAQVRALAVVLRVPTSQAFERMTRDSFALAARGERNEPDWSARVDRYVESWLGNERRP